MAASPLAMGEERRISNRPNKWTPDPYIAPNATTRFDPFLAQDGLIRLPRSSKNLPTSGVSDVSRILFFRVWSRFERGRSSACSQMSLATIHRLAHAIDTNEKPKTLK